MNDKGQTVIKFEDGKYVGYVNGKVVVKSTSEYYVKRKVGEMATAFMEAPKKVDAFGINKRFQFVEQMVSMIASGLMPSVVITGEGGLGKSYTVMKALDSNGLVNLTDLAMFEAGTKVNLKKAYRVIKGYSTAKGLYRTLYESNGMTVVFDDCDSILKDDVARNLL